MLRHLHYYLEERIHDDEALSEGLPSVGITPIVTEYRERGKLGLRVIKIGRRSTSKSNLEGGIVYITESTMIPGTYAYRMEGLSRAEEKEASEIIDSIVKDQANEAIRFTREQPRH